MEKSGFITKLTQIVLNNLNNEQFGVEDLSESYGLSRSQLHKKLKKQTGKSVSQFIREIRLDEAKKLLENDGVTASEVAYQVGFSSATYFNTRFKDYFGYPPGEVKVRVGYENSLNETFQPKSLTITKWQKWTAAFLGLVLLVIAGVLFFKKNQNPENNSEVSNQALLTDSVSNEKTIAVLPLKNWSGNPNLEYISDGMTDAIISKLAKIGAIERVVPFTSIVAYKNTEKSINEIADELKVKNILQGSFQLAGDNVNVKLQMIEGDSEKQFWENEFKRAWKTDEIFDLQSEVAENVAFNINADITATELKTIYHVPTSSKEAYRQYLKAESYKNELSVKGFETARPLYEKAIQLDSTFVDAYLGLANLHLVAGYVWGINNEENSWENSKKYFEKALAIDMKISGGSRKSIENRLLHAKFHFEWDFASFEKFYQNAGIYEFNDFPDIGSQFSYSRKVGRFSDTFKSAEYALSKFPTLSSSYVHMACALYFNKRHHEAINLLREKDKIYNYDYYFLMETGKYYHYLGEQEKSKEQLRRFEKLFENRPPIILWLKAIHAEMEGNPDIVKESLVNLNTLYYRRNSGSPAWFLALYYCHIEDYERAFEWLEKSYERHEVEMTWLKTEPILEPLREDPRYILIYEKVGFADLDRMMEKQTILP